MGPPFFFLKFPTGGPPRGGPPEKSLFWGGGGFPENSPGFSGGPIGENFFLGDFPGGNFLFARGQKTRVKTFWEFRRGVSAPRWAGTRENWKRNSVMENLPGLLGPGGGPGNRGFAHSHWTRVEGWDSRGVAIAISAPHRREALAACAEAIDRLKARLPVWKKEVFADGSEWRENREGEELDDGR